MGATIPRNRRLRRTLLLLVTSCAYSSNTSLDAVPPPALPPSLDGSSYPGIDALDPAGLRDWAHRTIVDEYRSAPVCGWRFVSNTVRALPAPFVDLVLMGCGWRAVSRPVRRRGPALSRVEPCRAHLGCSWVTRGEQGRARAVGWGGDAPRHAQPPYGSGGSTCRGSGRQV